MKTWQLGHTIIPKRQDGGTPVNLQLQIVKYYPLLLACTILQLFYNVLQSYLIPCMHHYSTYYLREFLGILISGCPSSNIAIGSSTSSCALNIWVIPFSFQYSTNYGLRIIIFEPYVGTTKSSKIGNTYIFWPGMMVTGNTMIIIWTHTNTSHT